MSLLKSLAITFSMYSTLPVKQFAWEKRDMRYCLACLPLVGAVEGLALLAFYSLFHMIKMPPLLIGAFLTLFPLVFTGGIHMDGFMDSLDGMASNRGREEKLKILRDSHTGAFAVIGYGMYLLLYFAGVLSFTKDSQVELLALSFVLIRSYSALSLVVFKNARGQGLAYDFTKASHIFIKRGALLFFTLVSSISMLFIHLGAGLVAGITVFLVFFFYRVKAFEEFGGITGDLAGFFLQTAELTVVLVLALLPF